MPITWTIDEERQRLRTVWTGVLDDQVVLSTYEQVYAGRWQPGFDELADLRQADLGAATAGGLEKLGSFTARRSGGVLYRTAVVVGRDLEYGLTRMYETLNEKSPQRIGLFREIEEALEWLDGGR